MTIQAFFLGVIAATLAGALFHLFKNGGIGKLLLYLVLSWIGFFTGHGLAQNTAIVFMDVGPLHLGWGIVGSLLFLLVGHWLSLVRVERSS